MVRRKDSDYLRSEYQQRDSGYHRIPGTHCCGYVHSFSDPVCFPCTNILSGKCSCRHTDTQYRQDIKSIDFYITGHNCRSKTIHTCLHDQVWKRNYNILDSCRDSDADDLRKQMIIASDLLNLQLIYIFTSDQKSPYKNAWYQLTDICSQCRANDSKLQSDNHNQIQEYIWNRRDHQINQGSPRIPHRIQNTCRHIVNYRK